MHFRSSSVKSGDRSIDGIEVAMMRHRLVASLALANKTVQLSTMAVNVTLLAFAAVRLAVVAPAVKQSSECRAHSSKPASVECGGRMMGYGQTDARPLHRRCSAY